MATVYPRPKAIRTRFFMQLLPCGLINMHTSLCEAVITFARLCLMCSKYGVAHKWAATIFLHSGIVRSLALASERDQFVDLQWPSPITHSATATMQIDSTPYLSRGASLTPPHTYPHTPMHHMQNGCLSQPAI